MHPAHKGGVWTIDKPRSAIISTRSRKLSLKRRYHRTHKTMTSRSKWRPSNSSAKPSVPILTKDSQGPNGVRLWWHEADFGMHLAVSCGSGDAGRLDFGTEYAAEAGLAEPDRCCRLTVQG